MNNTNDIVQNEHLTRQLDIIPMVKLNRYPVHIIGCGAIGSFVGLSLAKMGVTRISCWDMDVVSIENMSNQFFRFADIGNNKAVALRNLVHSFTNITPVSNDVAFEPNHAASLEGVVVVAVDSMAARRMIFEAIKETGFNVKFIIDPRMSAEFYTQYTMNPFLEKDQESYEKVLQSDADSVVERCTAKSTIYTATLAAGLVCKTVKDLLIGNEYPRVTNWDISACSSPLVMHPGNVEALLPQGAPEDHDEEGYF